MKLHYVMIFLRSSGDWVAKVKYDEKGSTLTEERAFQTKTGAIAYFTELVNKFAKVQMFAMESKDEKTRSEKAKAFY